MRTLILVACLGVLAPSIAHATQPTTAATRTPAAEIDALIDRVAHAKGVVFIRNGKEYTAPDAAAHLKRKREAAGNRITTPEQFIDKIGARSSMSGKPYRVRLPDGKVIDSAVWLDGLLREIRTRPAEPSH